MVVFRNSPKAVQTLFQEDVAKISPLHVLGVGLVAGLLFVAGLILLVNWVVAK